MTEVTRQAMLDDGGLFTTGTIINEAFVDQLYDQIDDQCHSTTNPTVKPKATTDEVVTARGSMASLDARLDVSLNADGTLAASFANVSGGLRVGFAGTTSADRIDLGDANLYWDLAAGGAGVPGIVFDTNDSILFDRAGNQIQFVVGGAAHLVIDTAIECNALLEIAQGSAAAPGLHGQNADSGLFFGSDGALGVSTGGAERSRWAVVGQFNVFKGSDVASAATITITGNVFHVTGTTTITSVSGSAGGTAVKAGTVVTLIFDDALTFTDGSNLKLAGNLVTTADDTITIVFDGTNWYEVCRSVN